MSIHDGPGLALSIAYIPLPHPSQCSSDLSAVTMLHRQADRELVRVDDLFQGAIIRTRLLTQAGMTSEPNALSLGHVSGL